MRFETSNVVARRYCDRQHIFLEGDEEPWAYLVEAGAVRLYNTTPDGKRQIFGFAFRGDIIGLEATEWCFLSAQAIGMALHELATNAGKYGVLSQSKGKVIIHWNTAKTDQGVNIFVMDWQEEGGPLVTTPKRRGFGSTLLQEILELNLNAEVELDYAPSGQTKARFCLKSYSLPPQR